MITKGTAFGGAFRLSGGRDWHIIAAYRKLTTHFQTGDIKRLAIAN